MNLPTIEIIFKRLASTAVARSQRGVAVLIVRDDTSTAAAHKQYKNIAEAGKDKSLYTSENYAYIGDTLTFAPSVLHVVRIAAAGKIEDALTAIGSITKTGWITCVGVAADYTALTAWVKAQNTSGRTYKAVVYKATAPNDTHVVNFMNDTVSFTDSRKNVTGDKYLPSLVGVLASCNIDSGCTGYVCRNLQAVKEVESAESTLTAGGFILVNDFDKVRIGLGINSLTSLAPGDTEDMKYIDIVETMDLIKDDISSTFKETYQGKYKNGLDNQILFISAVNTYFAALSRQNVLDTQYTNKAEVDIAAQRAAWATVKPEAESWDDDKVRQMSYRRDVFLAGDIKILGSMENLKFNISMF